MADRPLISARNITKTFPGVKALDNVHFDLYRGEVHVLLGENGAGKSTLMKILAGAYVPDSGEVIIDGQPVHEFNPRMAQQLGVSIIYQEFNLIPYMNVAQNIFLGRFPKKNGLLDHAKLHADDQSLACRPEHECRYPRTDCRTQYRPATNGRGGQSPVRRIQNPDYG